jgi:hypothetical protein
MTTLDAVVVLANASIGLAYIVLYISIRRGRPWCMNSGGR